VKKSVCSKQVHVLVATPFGRGGKGGIDRIMDGLGEELTRSKSEELRVYFGATRGERHIVFSPFYLLVFLLRMTVLRLAGKCDLIHINVSQGGSIWRKLIIAEWARFLGIPYIQHIHGSRFRDFFESSDQALQKRVRSLLSRAAHVIVLGTAWRDFVLTAELATADRIVILPNAVPIPRKKWRAAVDGKRRILFLGQLGERKGTPQLVEALARLRYRRDWKAVLAGDGEFEKWRHAVAVSGMDGEVQVPGWVGAEDIERLLAESDILVLPSFAENLPMSVIEGMAAGLAIVSTPVGATPDIIQDNETGLLVPPGDVDALTQALEALVDDASLRQRLGASAKAFHREHLEIGAYARRLVTVWTNAAL
jgi:glycosyltransferase involved in cell wall biosynthesis